MSRYYGTFKAVWLMKSSRCHRAIKKINYHRGGGKVRLQFNENSEKNVILWI